MKRIGLWCALIVVIGVFSSGTSVYAKSGRAYSIRASYFSPSDAKAGFTFGGSVGTMIDEAVEIGVGADIFYKNYRKDTWVATEVVSGIVTKTGVTEVQYDTVIFPVMLELRVKFPALWKGAVFAHGGIGYEVLWNREQNFSTKVKDTRWYGGFTWLAGGGFSFDLGSSSAFFVEGYYNNAKVRRNLKDAIKDLPVFEEADLSGLGVRVGFSLGPL
jgi:hypothetical protein